MQPGVTRKRRRHAKFHPIRTTSLLARLAFEEMTKQDISVEEMGEKIGRHPNVLTRWRQGHSEPKVIDVESMFQVLGMEVLFAKRGKPNERRKVG